MGEYVRGAAEYEDVFAMQVGNGTSLYRAGSTGDEGTITAGYWIDWTTSGGYSGTQGWSPQGTYYAEIEGLTVEITLDGTVGPTAGMSDEEVAALIEENNGTLNSVFSNWSASDDVKLYFAAAMASVSCANRVD